jgi:hypothetical protein
MAVTGSYGAQVAYDPSKVSVGMVTLKYGESELMIGDALMLFNHSAYNALNKTQGHSWRLENAIVTDRQGLNGSFRFQGHGSHKSHAPQDRATFIQAMQGKFNSLYDIAKGLILAGSRKLAKDFPFVRPKGGTGKTTKLSKVPSDFEVVYSKTGSELAGVSNWEGIAAGDVKAMELRPLKDADYPNPFAPWGEAKEKGPDGTASFWVWRPVEGFKD